MAQPRSTTSERRRLALGQATAARILEEPDLLDVGRSNLRQLRSGATQSGLVLLAEWALIIECGPEAVAEVLGEDSERGHDMRQQSPFAGVLSDRARWSVLEEVYDRPLPQDWLSNITPIYSEVPTENLIDEERGRG